MAIPSKVVLTTAKAQHPATEFLPNRELFPAEPIPTADVAKARQWEHYIGAHRFLERHAKAILSAAPGKDWRPVRIPLAMIQAAAAADTATAAIAAAAATRAPEPAPARKPGRRSTSNRRTKTDPDRRQKRARRVKAVRVARKRSGKPGARRQGKARKVAA